MSSILATKIEYLKGVGSQKALLLQQELQIATFDDLLQHYPFRYEDCTQFHKIEDVQEGMPYVQLKGTLHHIKTIVTGKKRVTAYLKDSTAGITLVWFQGIPWILKKLKIGVRYTVWGKPSLYNNQVTLIHPELEIFTPSHEKRNPLIPVYHTTETLRKNFLDSKAIMKLQQNLFRKAINHIQETIPASVLQCYGLMRKKEALLNIHFPKDHQILQKARFRLKFEELFYIQLHLLKLRQTTLEKPLGRVFQDTRLFKRFYQTCLPFRLTGAQKQVIKEIYKDMKAGKQMNRLLQGDVGSGKTIVAFLSMLIVLAHGAQVAIMAPTELLAAQHYKRLQAFAAQMDLHIALLTGATKPRERKELLALLKEGTLKIIVGTHALFGDTVQFKELGLVVIDEQHRFGVMQRAKLWKKNASYIPHVLIMTATPIPRTLAMTLYGDLDVSVIDEMPAGRKPIKTMHYYEAHRLKVFQFLSEQIAIGRQVYIVYPLIDESANLDHKNLLAGYESICRAFPALPISIIHGKMTATDKEYEMQRFVKGETKIMIATTVIEVGINVPNATVMVIENAERFGLAQLHQLRGRVGRGSEQAYCVLMTDYKLSEKGRERIQALLHTNNGFEIADKDLQLRGPGDLMGVQQSGVLKLKIADLGQDGAILQVARKVAKQVINKDPLFTTPENTCIQAHYKLMGPTTGLWSRIG